MSDKHEWVWVCRCCGFMVSDLQMKSFRCDVGCGRCSSSLSNFIPKKKPLVDAEGVAGCKGDE